MALPNEIGDREQQKFVETDDGKVAVRGQASNINGISAANTSTTLLAANAEFTGTWTDVSSYASVMVSVLTDEPGNLFMDFNTTNSGNPVVSTIFAVEGGIHQAQKLPIAYQYFRVKYVNAGFVQTSFALATLFGDYPPPVAQPVELHAGANLISVLKRNNMFELSTNESAAQGILADILEELKAHRELISLYLE